MKNENSIIFGTSDLEAAQLASVSTLKTLLKFPDFSAGGENFSLPHPIVIAGTHFPRPNFLAPSRLPSNSKKALHLIFEATQPIQIFEN